MSSGRGKIELLRGCGRRALLGGFLGLAALPVCAVAQEADSDVPPERSFELTPFISGKESFSDNVFNTEDGRQSDFITTLEAGVDVTNRSRRSELDFTYTLSRDIYADNSELNGERHSMRGRGEVEVIEDWLNFDANIAISEQNVSQTGSTTASDRTASSDRTRIINYGFGPSLEHAFGRWASTELAYQFKGVEFQDTSTGASDSAPSNSTIHEITYTLESGPKFGKLGMGFDASYVDTDKDEGDDTKRKNAQVRGEYNFTTHFAGTARVGYDDYDGNDGSENFDGAYGFIGARAQFTDRVDASVEVGRRNDNPTFTADVSYQPTSRTEFTLSHDQTVQTQQERLASQPIFVNGILVNPNDLGTDLVDSTTRTQSLDVGFSHRRERTEFTSTVRFRQRDFTIDDSDDATLSVGLDLSHDFTRKATGTWTLDYSDIVESRTSDGGQTSYRMGLELDYDLNDTLKTMVGYDFLYRTEEAGEDILENVLFVSLRKDF